MEKNIIFIHIPKAAGTTFDSIMGKNIPAKNLLILDKINPVSEIRKIKNGEKPVEDNINYISGHMGFGLHNYLNKKFKYIAFFREPVRRIISHYYYIKRSPEHYLYKEIVERGISLREYVSSDLTHEIENGQVRIVASDNGEDITFKDKKKIKKEDFEKAVKNINNYFLFAGLKEKFNLSLMILKRKLNLKNTFYFRRNVSKKKPAVKEISDDILDIIKERNRYDIKLYNHIQKNLKSELDEYGKNIYDELKKFERKNELYSSFVKPYFKLRNFLKKTKDIFK